MPFPPPSRLSAGPRRRSLLASAAGAVLLAGCSGGSGASGTEGSASAEDRARARAARDSERLVGEYDAVLTAHPRLAERLHPLRAEVVRHAKAFGGGAATASPSAAGRPAGSTSPSAVDTRSPSGPAAASASAGGAVPADPSAALARLAAAERSLADRRIAELAGLPGETARLLASVAAAGAAHAYLLTEEKK